ncbi:MAG: ferritin family protein [Candidatus Cloacimonadales bacterium]
MQDKKSIYEMVIQEEIKAQNLYRGLAKAMGKTDSNDIFAKLIKIEELHEETITRLYREDFPKAKLEIDKNLRPDIVAKESLESPHAALQFAISKEEHAAEIYLELAEKSTAEEHRQLFLKFAEDEKNHKELLLDEVSRLSGSMMWYDEAELNGLMEY